MHSTTHSTTENDSFLLIRQDWKDCKRCPLHKVRSRVVFYRGQLPCTYAFIGEAPGISENSLGYPFEGEAGHLLNQLFVEIGIGDFALMNLLGCIPRETDTSNTIRPPRKAEIRACQPRLERLLDLAQAKVHIALGAVAERELVVDFSLPHPASVLRSNPKEQAYYYNKLKLGLKEVKEYGKSL